MKKMLFCRFSGGLLLMMMLNGCLSSGSNTATDLSGDKNSQRITLNNRNYLLALPANYQADKSYKLLLAFHGSGGSAADMRGTARFEQYSGNYIVAYPESEQVEWNDGCGCNIAHRLGADDLGFVDKVIADVKQRHQIIEGEIYAAGFSQGALFTQNLVCNRSDTFKAVATVAAPMSVQLANNCPQPQPVSIMMVHGKQDQVLPYEGLEHSNFGLISARGAIKGFALRNNSLPYPLQRQLADKAIELTSFSNGSQKAELYTINNGSHSWSFNQFDTSAQIMRFFAELDKPELPEHSRLINANNQHFHVRTMGQQQGPAIILLPGPNYNYHSDTAWFALLQPLLAQQYRVHAIDRLGNGWSDYADNVSYQRFGDDLAVVLNALGENDVVLVAFASASISARLFYQQHHHNYNVLGMLWVDPDIPLAHSLSLYKGYPADWYKANLAGLLPHLASGAWTERTWQKLQLERQEAEDLVPAKYAERMDWAYFDQLSQQRLLIPNQQARAIEIAHYDEDLDAYAALPLLNSIPVSVIDSDFEEKDIAANPEIAELLRQWQQEGSAWSKDVAAYSNGQYITLSGSDHMVMLQQPDVVINAVQWLLQQQGR